MDLKRIFGVLQRVFFLKNFKTLQRRFFKEWIFLNVYIINVDFFKEFLRPVKVDFKNNFKVLRRDLFKEFLGSFKGSSI